MKETYLVNARILDPKNQIDEIGGLIIDSKGQTAIHSGNNSLGIWSEAIGDNIISAGNLLANKEVTKAIISVFIQFKSTKLPLIIKKISEYN